MGTGRGETGPSKKDRREQAREHARLMREEAQKKARRRKWWIQGSVGIAVVAVLAIVALVIVNAAKPEGPGPKNMASDGIVLTSTTKALRTPALSAGEKSTPTAQSDKGDVAHITIYLDYQCPYCQQFEKTNGTQIGQWLDQGLATLEIHPLSLLDRSSLGNRYSSRAANAAACVANYKPDSYYKVNTTLFADQPAENTKGMSNEKLLSILKDGGASSSAITSCVNDEQFKGWVNASTQRASTEPVPNSKPVIKGITGTPTVLVDGSQYQGQLDDASAFQSFVASVMNAEVKNSTASPTPTPTPTATK
ncbi:MAG TPA: thioredoxin domain-containing protein [Humibacter sp.]|nr:thioredoxin domain-containing protein [Humibacter sp.]